jgi:hypothetical protein
MIIVPQDCRGAVPGGSVEVSEGASFRQVERRLQKKSEVYKYSKLRELLLFAGQHRGSTV